MKELPTHKQCSTCKVTKPRSEFYARKERRDGLQPACKDCQREHQRAWRKAHPDAYRKTSRRSYAKTRGVTDVVAWDSGQALLRMRKDVSPVIAEQLQAIADELLTGDS